MIPLSWPGIGPEPKKEEGAGGVERICLRRQREDGGDLAVTASTGADGEHRPSTSARSSCTASASPASPFLLLWPPSWPSCIHKVLVELISFSEEDFNPPA